MKTRETMEHCDNPDCNNSYLVSRDEPAPGFHLGKGFYVLGGGGPIPATYACSYSCIKLAIRHMIEEGTK